MSVNQQQESGTSKDESIAVLKLKVDILTETIGEIKGALQRIEEIVGVIRIIEVQSKQQTKEFDRLVKSVNSIRNNLSQVEQTLSDEIDKGDKAAGEHAEKSLDELKNKLKALTERVDTIDSSWTARYNIGKGMWIVISAIVVLLGGWLGSLVLSNVQKIDSANSWIQRETIAREERDKAMKGSSNASPTLQAQASTTK